ncbi:MAG: collagen-like protein [Oscillospiraceae bacterium]|nr:collagen-like protein [Oscillospiraceae bacterium]
MIQFKDWQIWADPRLTLQQNDHLSRELRVSGPLPEGWDWTMLVQADGQMDIWPLAPCQNGVSTLLTAQQLGPGGFYRMQLRGTQGETVRHSNVITLFVPRSLCGDKQWPVLPTEFSDAERRILTARDEAENFSNHPPILQNGTWWLWDGENYADSGAPSRGEAGIDGAPGQQGPQGEPGPAYELTEADRAEIVAAVVAALPVYNGEVEDV